MSYEENGTCRLLQPIDYALLDSEARTRAVLAAAVDAIITIDEKGIIESVNPAGEKLFGYAAPEIIGKNVNMLMPSPYQGEHDGYLFNYITTGEKKIIGIGREVLGLRKDRSTFPMDLAVSEVLLEGRRLFTGIVRDITECKTSRTRTAGQRSSDKGGAGGRSRCDYHDR